MLFFNSFKTNCRFLLILISILVASNAVANWPLHESPFFSDYSKFQRLESGPILLGTLGGVSVSFDEGTTWTFSTLSTLDTTSPAHSPAFDAVELDDGTVYVVMGNTYRADPGLLHFTRIAWPQNLHFAEASGDTIWAAGINEIHRSLDRGTTWNQVYNVPNNYDDLTSLMRNPANGSLVAQVLKVGGLFITVSSDGGLTWTEQTLGGMYGEMVGMEFSDDGTLWMAHNYQHHGNLRTTSDNGATHQQIYSAPSNMEIGDLTLGPANRMAITQGAGMVVSLNGGTTFETRVTGYAHPAPLFFTGGERLLAGTREGVLISEDEGLNWSLTREGLWANFNFKADVTPDGTAWITSSGYLWHDAPGTWQLLDMPGGVGQLASVLRCTSTGRILLLSQNQGTPEGYFTDNNGNTWQAMSGLDGINSWSPFTNIIEHAGVLYAGHESLGIFVSTNNGTSWENRSTEAVGEISRSGDGTLWAIYYNTLRKSTDNGFNWTTLNSSAANGFGIASPITGTYVADTFTSVERTTDGGITWTNVFNTVWSTLGNANMSANHMQSMCYAANGDLIMAVQVLNYANYRTEIRLMLSPDDGDSFVDITGDSGIKYAYIKDMKLSANGGLIATTNQGLFGDAFELHETPVGEMPAGLSLLGKNYPNPFNPRTVIPFSLPRESQVKLTITDIRGARVATLVDRVMGEGVHQVPFNGTSLASGVYLYQLVVDGRVLGGKMTLSK